MHYLIDTYNLIHAAVAVPGPVSPTTVRMLCQHLAASPLRATLVLDGRPKPDEPSVNEFPDITLIYSGAGVKADTVIAQKVELCKMRKKLTVVSNDRAVVLQARRCYANAIGCEQFLKLLTETRGQPRKGGDTLPAHKTEGTPTQGESDLWLSEFGLTKEPETPDPLAPKGDDVRIEEIDVEDLLGPRE
jgi:hypothetical protein